MPIKYQFQHHADTLEERWIVTVPREAFEHPVDSWPDDITLGTVEIKGRLADTTFLMWSHSYYNKSAAAEAGELLRSGEMFAQLMVARAEHARIEQTSGTFICQIGDEKTRWHTMTRAQTYASVRLRTIWSCGLQLARRAEFSRSETAGVFSAIEISEYGHERIASLARKPEAP